MSASYVAGRGVIVSLQGTHEGTMLVIPDHWTLQAIEKHLHELQEFLSYS